MILVLKYLSLEHISYTSLSREQSHKNTAAEDHGVETNRYLCGRLICNKHASRTEHNRKIYETV